ncbi:MAG: ThuA domain-containing protein [Saprospirales bacterium]|nr:ThuA domain-containing protein [Saprospirales bacterium]
MKPSNLLLVLAGLALGMLGLQQCAPSSKAPKVLILAKSEFYVHQSTPAAIEAISKICEESGWDVEVTEDPWGYFEEKKLPKYAAVIFLNTAGDVFSPTEEILFERYIEAGGGYVGIHTAIDTEHNWEWYGELVGGRFAGMTEVQEATLQVLDRSHPSTQHLDSVWRRKDEWFNLTSLSPDMTVLINVDEKSYEGGKMGVLHPIAWRREFDGGRVFFTGMGHTAEAYSEPDFLEHLKGGIAYAIGKHKPIVLKKSRSKKPEAPATGFVKTSLACNLFEPMEMEMLPDGRVLLIERRGDLKLFDPTSGEIKVVGSLDVFQDNEEGLLGLAIDPQFEQNKWIYLYYAPLKGTSAIHLSRFEFSGDALQYDTEKVLFEVVTDRSVHNFHAGGSILFDEDGYLYVAAGDNTDHYSDGFTAIDERIDKSQYDAQKSASNSMDLRGKILRIKPQPDGSYICPAGNMFVEKDLHVSAGGKLPLSNLQWGGLARYMPGLESTALKGRPEVFVMGVRNPFRFAVDSRRKLLMWGEPGPDAGLPDTTRGPEGYDEFNWTRKAGFFGWPYFVGDNQPYREYDFETNTPGPWFDPAGVYNDSPHNTGEKVLPPAQPAPIWYPFRSSDQFPILVNGTRCAMGGPVYYNDKYPADTRYPDRLNGKFFIYEWMRCWVLLLEIDSLDQFVGLEPFAPSIRLSRPIDMLIDKNGLLWVLEYGNDWYAQNPDACLSRIDYIRGEDGEEDLAATGANTTPRIRWDLFGKNRSFYTPGDKLRYRVEVNDTQDGSVESGSIPMEAVSVTIEYLDAASRPGNLAQNFKPSSPFAGGKELLDASDCKSCHAVDRKVIGPSYKELAARYGNDKKAPAILGKKIVQGGSGVWGDVAMAAHPQISAKDAEAMAGWILSLSDPANLPLLLEGSYELTLPAASENIPVFVFHASYQDRGAGEHPPLRGAQTLVLRPPMLEAEQADTLSKNARTVQRSLNGKPAKLCEMKDGAFLTFCRIDLTGITALEVFADTPLEGSKLELHIGSPEGRIAGTASLQGAGPVSIAIDRSALPTDGSLQDLYLVAVNEKESSKAVVAIDWVKFKM